MESPSQAPHSGGSPWKGLLLTASILSYWMQLASAQSDSVSVVPNPPYGTVGSSVILDIQGASEQGLRYDWYRGTIDNSSPIASYVTSSGALTTTDSRLNVSSSGSLLISNLTLSDTDDYIVQFVKATDYGTVQARAHLAVYGPPSKPTISSTNMAPLEKEDNVSLTCQFENEDVTSMVWFINQSSPAGNRIVLSSDNRTLTIIKVTREDQGPYQCEIQNPVNVSRSDPFTLNITYGPDTPTIAPVDSYYSVGATLELSCSADSNPPSQYTWLFNGMQMESTSQLYISNVSLNHTGTYTCIASNSVTGMSASRDINVTISGIASKPNITASSANVMENSTVDFICVTEQKGMNILWFFNDALLSLSERTYLSENNKTLTIETVTREDAGSYQCEVWNLISTNRSDSFTLTVNYGPDNIMILPYLGRDEIEAILNNPLILVCQVESYPPAQYEWRVNGTVNSSDNTYTINNVSWEDSGKYTCLVWNNMTELSVSKDVTIRVVSDESPGGGNGSSLYGGAIAGIVIGALAAMTLIGVLIYFPFLRKKTGGANKEHLSQKPSALKHGEGTTVYENTGFPEDSALSAQGLDSFHAFSQVRSENAYQALDISRVDVYEDIIPWKKPQA